MFAASRLRYFALKCWRSIWFRPAAYAVLALVALALTPVLQPVVPQAWVMEVDEHVVDRILDILTASMLPVAIFSLTTMVMQLNAAAQAATPRSRPLLAEDRTAQNAISTFIGTFLFAVLGTIGIGLQLYDSTSLFVLFCLSLVLIALVILNLILWIRRLSLIGGVGEAMERVERATNEAFAEVAADPWLGGQRYDELPDGLHAVTSDQTGFIQTIDRGRLGELAGRFGHAVYLVARPGDFVDRERSLARLAHRPDDDTIRTVREAFVIGHDRDFRSDPRYGVLVLSEIASRALSTGVNDPGTAVDVIGTLLRTLSDWRSAEASTEPECRHPDLYMRELDPGHVLEEGFRPISRDGAGLVEVGIRLQQALSALSRIDEPAFGDMARRLSADHLERARAQMEFHGDVRALEEAAERYWKGGAVNGGSCRPTG